MEMTLAPAIPTPGAGERGNYLDFSAVQPSRVTRSAPKHRDALAALVDRAYAGAILLGAGDVGIAVDVYVDRTRHRHVGAEAIPSLGIREADPALAHHVDGGAHIDKDGVAGT